MVLGLNKRDPLVTEKQSFLCFTLIMDIKRQREKDPIVYNISEGLEINIVITTFDRERSDRAQRPSPNKEYNEFLKPIP